MDIPKGTKGGLRIKVGIRQQQGQVDILIRGNFNAKSYRWVSPWEDARGEILVKREKHVLHRYTYVYYSLVWHTRGWEILNNKKSYWSQPKLSKKIM